MSELVEDFPGAGDAQAARADERSHQPQPGDVRLVVLRLRGGRQPAVVQQAFPQVYAALNGITTSPADALVPRTLMQLVFLAATVTVLASSVRGRRLPRRSAVASDSAQVVAPISAVTGMRGDADGQAWASRTSTLPSRTRVR
jgi:hypothetical protein